MKKPLIEFCLIVLTFFFIQNLSAAYLPEFNRSSEEAWINSKPLKLSDVKGKPLLVEFWTSSWINCLKSKPWVYGIKIEYVPKGLHIISVHTPEFQHEENREHVEKTAKLYLCDYPIMIDNDASYWRAVKLRFWPAYLLVNREGEIIKTAYGEMQEGLARADGMEAAIKRLLKQ